MRTGPFLDSFVLLLINIWKHGPIMQLGRGALVAARYGATCQVSCHTARQAADLCRTIYGYTCKDAKMQLASSRVGCFASLLSLVNRVPCMATLWMGIHRTPRSRRADERQKEQRLTLTLICLRKRRQDTSDFAPSFQPY